MDTSKDYEFLSKDISIISGIGKKTKELLKKKKIEKISDILWDFPHSYTDRSKITNLNKLEIGTITTIKVNVKKYYFPRIRNLPNKVICEEPNGKIEIIFFNSKEGYIRKILPINNWVIISGKVGFYKNKYQITNPSYIVPLYQKKYVTKIIPKYSLTEGISEKTYRKITEQVLQKIPNLREWHSNKILKLIGNENWKKSIINLHTTKEKNFNSNCYRRLAYDEILSHFIVMSKVRQIVQKFKKNKKKFTNMLSNKIIKKFDFNLTNNQKKIVEEINIDLRSENKMFRLLQGDVGSGKTIVALIGIANTIESKQQAVLMAPTEILAKQHYNLAKKIFSKCNITISFLSGNTLLSEKKAIIKNLKLGKINFIIGTHALFQEKIIFKKLGIIIIDEQHKFGVKQRISLSKKGGSECDILLMSATPIPRTLILTFYGDMNVSRLIEKPSKRKNIITLSKSEKKIDEIISFLKKQIELGNQVFWVCPLIDESKKSEFSAVIQKYKFLNNFFPNKVGLIHGNLKKNEKDLAINNFLNKNFDILVSTTVIEVGIDIPNANIIIIENSNKFGLSQLHQLRGRVGRGINQGYCILLYKDNLSENAKKRIKILKSTNDGFVIAEEDMKLRGFGDILGYKQSGIKDFKIADPVQHEDLFDLAEINIKDLEKNDKTFNKFEILLKLFDKADIINKMHIEN